MRFSLQTMLLATAFVAITVAGYCAGWRTFYEIEGLPQFWFSFTAFGHARALIEGLWVWLPLLFFAFAAGARRLTVRMLIAFAVCECGAIALLPIEYRIVEHLYSEAVPPVVTP